MSVFEMVSLQKKFHMSIWEVTGEIVGRVVHLYPYGSKDVGNNNNIITNNSLYENWSSTRVW